MNFDNLQKAYEQYAEDRCNDTFVKLYREAENLFKKINRGKIGFMGDRNDADEIFDETVWQMSQRDGITNFGAFLSTGLKNGRCDFFRKEGRHTSRVIAYLDDSERCPVTLRAPEPPELTGKEKEQRQLLQSLIEYSGNEVAIAVVDLGQTRADLTSITEICTALNFHHVQGFRAMRRLSRGYDPVKHGDITDYFPAGVRVQRQYISA